MTIRIGSLCTGYGGLDMAVESVLGGELTWYSEYEPPTEKRPKPSQAAATLLAYRYPGVPNLGDMTAVDWSSIEPVDVLTGGTPCQDVSHAGSRRGMRAGTRSGIWASMVDAIDALRPELVVWENVRGVTYAEADSDVEPCPLCLGDGTGDALRALGRVLGDLADVGYDAEWVGFPASAVGAAHDRFRVFVVAHPRRGGWAARWQALGRDRAQADATGRGEALADPEGSGLERGLTFGPGPEQPRSIHGADPAAHTQGLGRGEGGTEPAGELRGPDVALGGPVAADPDGDGLARLTEHDDQPQAGQQVGALADIDGRALVDWGRYRDAVERWERVLGRRAPTPARPNRNGTPKLSPEFDEWLMGLPAGWITDVPGISWNDQLKLCGNGVVPQQAAAALRHLLDLS